MQTIYGMELAHFALTDSSRYSDERLQAVITSLSEALSVIFPELKIGFPGTNIYMEMLQHFHNFLFSLELHTHSEIKFYIPNNNIAFKLEDLCDKHKKASAFNRDYCECDQCYFRFKNNLVCKSVIECLHKMQKLDQNITDPEISTFVRGVQLMYFSKVIVYSNSLRSKEPLLAPIYLEAVNCLNTTLKRLLAAPELIEKHIEKTSKIDFLYKFYHATPSLKRMSNSIRKCFL